MFFLNLSAGEFFALLGIVSSLVTALYFFDRSKRKRIVSTLRFWTSALGADQQSKRRSVREPWSLLLQLLSLALLLLAIAQVEWGSRAARIRNHVLLLDTSSAALQTRNGESALDREKALALQYLSRLNSRDRVMVIYANGLATPVTPFTADRAQIRDALNGATGTYSALSIEHALFYARQAESWASGAAGEIVYIGPGRTVESGAAPGTPRLRVLPVTVDGENAGIKSIAITQAGAANSWHATVGIKNYGSKSRVLTMRVQFAGTSFAPRRFSIGPRQETAAEYEFETSVGGQFTAQIEPDDGFKADDHASVNVPEDRPTRVAVFTSRSEAWKPLLSSDARLDVKFFPTSEYQARPYAEMMILDRFAPSNRPQIPSLWVDPPQNGSPLPVSSTVSDQMITHWSSDAELSAGLHARDVLLSKAEVFQLFEGDFAVATTALGPVAVVRRSREGGTLAVVGFDFLGEPLRFKVSSPILFANLVRWLAPQAFRTLQLSAGAIGTAEITVNARERADKVSVTDQRGAAVPFTARENKLQVYVGEPTTVHVVSEQRERVLSLVLPEIAPQQWKPPSNASVGLPGFAGSIPAAIGLWQGFALLGGLGLLAEWFLYGRGRANRATERAASAAAPGVPRHERELVSK